MVLLLKNLLFTVLVPGTVAVYLPLSIAGGEPVPAGPGRLLAAALFLLGAAVYGWCVWDFAAFGRGTPAPIDAPRRLVVRGLYRYTRNPIYLGVLTAILGWVVLYRTRELAVYGLAVALAFHLIVLLYEEPQLRRLFGDEYEAYCARVRRWLPGPHPAPAPPPPPASPPTC